MPELIGKLQATFKSTLHPSPEWRKCLCMSCFDRVKSALDSSPLFTTLHSEPLTTTLHLENLRYSTDRIGRASVSIPCVIRGARMLC